MPHRRATFGRRARAASLWGLLLFAGGQLATGLALDYAYPLVRFPSAGRVLAAARAEPRPPAVAFFGSSRTGAAVDAAEANRVLAAESGRKPPPRVVNLGVPAGDALAAEFLLERLLEAGVKPRWAVVEVSPETLNRRNLWMASHAVRQLTWADVPTHWRTAYRWHAGAYFAEARLVPAYTHRRQLLGEARAAVQRWLGGPPAGAVRADGPLDWDDILRPPGRPGDDELVRQSRAGVDRTVRRWLSPYRVAGVSPAALERALARCKTEGIGVVLLGIPACTAHRQAITPDIHAAYRGYLDRVCREYGCRFVDASDWVPDTDFLDTLHVRFDGGARAFTDRLVREVLLELPLD
jgi:hypothetical protein